MTKTELAVQGQLIAVVRQILSARLKRVPDLYNKAASYRNPMFSDILMSVMYLPIDNEKETIQDYYTIGVRTDSKQIPVDLMDVYFTDDGIYMAFQGIEVKCGCHVTGSVLPAVSQANWLGIAVRSNYPLRLLLQEFEDKLNANKKDSK